MSEAIQIAVPDIGDFKDVPVIEVLVKPGDRVNENDSLATLESDKASMEIPSTASGVVESVQIRVGDRVSKGSPIVTLTQDGAETAEAAPQTQARAEQPDVREQAGTTADERTAVADNVIELAVPDIGDFHDIPVIDVLIRPGDAVEREAPLVTLESDKASMDVPAAQPGTIEEVRVKIGDRVSKGTVIATLRTAQASPQPKPAAPPKSQPEPEVAPTRVTTPTTGHPPTHIPSQQAVPTNGKPVHASPGVRRLARELGVPLQAVKGSGPHDRITRDDVHAWVKRALSSGAPTQNTTSFAGLPPWPSVDFAQFGEIERKELPRIKRLSGPNLHRNWLQIPHITNYDEADITELEAFRQRTNGEQGKDGTKLTMLAFLVKACVAALKRYPEFNASLDGDALVYKKYYNIGFAADTPGGLVVPVLKHADTKGLLQIAREAAELAAKARDGKMGMGDMAGGTFTISSIGGIGGTQFTQIVNAPEVAILGATRNTMKPVWSGTTFEPRLILPISVSYDHRVIDGALAARFLNFVRGILADFTRAML